MFLFSSIFYSDQILSVTLWDKFALDFDDNHVKQKEDDGPVVIVLASMTIRTYKGILKIFILYLAIYAFSSLILFLILKLDNVYLSTCSASRLYINLEIPEVVAFADNLRR